MKMSFEEIDVFLHVITNWADYGFGIFVSFEMLRILDLRAKCDCDLAIFHNTNVGPEIFKYVLPILMSDYLSLWLRFWNARPLVFWIFHLEISPTQFTLVGIVSQNLRWHLE